jgi:ribosomal protein L11 methyltransferase
MIDWEQQWELFAPGFKDGVLPLRISNKTLNLLPGPGFGDLSHPTTQLMIDHLPTVIADTMIDVGCGSGILSLAAKAFNSKTVIGIDICKEAVAHAKRNALHNQLEITFVEPQDFQFNIEEATILMNMIYSEQRTAWESLTPLHSVRGNLVISGLLKEHKKEALDYWTNFGWKESKVKKKGEWILIHLIRPDA